MSRLEDTTEGLVELLEALSDLELTEPTVHELAEAACRLETSTRETLCETVIAVTGDHHRNQLGVLDYVELEMLANGEAPQAVKAVMDDVRTAMWTITGTYLKMAA